MLTQDWGSDYLIKGSYGTTLQIAAVRRADCGRQSDRIRLPAKSNVMAAIPTNMLSVLIDKPGNVCARRVNPSLGRPLRK